MSTVHSHDLIDQRDLLNLASEKSGLCVSLYMPTHPSGPESHQDPIRLRKLLGEAESRLLERGRHQPDIDQLLKPARDLIPDEFFWTHQSEGLAVFLSQDSSDSFRRIRLPAPFEQTVEIAGQFLVTPILSFLKPGNAFYVLAVSQNSCRLFRGTQFQMEELEPENLPKDLQSALGWWRERRLNFHSQPRSQSDAAIYHGHEEDDKSIDLAAYLRKVADPIKPLLYNQSAPLLFAGVENLFPIFRDAYGEKDLVAERITGNPDDLTAKQLHHLAWPIVVRHIQEQTGQIWDRYYAAQSQNHAAHDLPLILRACRNGLVETLLIAEGTRHLAAFDTESNQIVTAADSEHTEYTIDVLNLAAVWALRTGANVTAVPPSSVPDRSAAAAIFRGPLSSIPPSETNL